MLRGKRMSNTPFVDVFAMLVHQSTRPGAILSKASEKSDYHINIELLIFDRDEKAIEEVSEEINELLKQANRDEAMSERFTVLYNRSKELHERMKKIGEVQLTINPVTLGKSVKVFKGNNLEKIFNFANGEMFEDFFQEMRKFNESLEKEYVK